VVLFTLRLS